MTKRYLVMAMVFSLLLSGCRAKNPSESKKGLGQVIADAQAHYQNMTSGGLGQ